MVVCDLTISWYAQYSIYFHFHSKVQSKKGVHLFPRRKMKKLFQESMYLKNLLVIHVSRCEHLSRIRS